MNAFVSASPLVASGWTQTWKTNFNTPFFAAIQNRPHESINVLPRMTAGKPDVIIIGSGFGGLSAAAALTAYGKTPLVLESHYSPGGVAHGFKHRTKQGVFLFDTGPSFFCGLSTHASLNPLKHALDAVGASVKCVSYPSFCIDDLQKGTVYISEKDSETFRSIKDIAGSEAVRQLKHFYDVMGKMHAAMDVPAVALRGDWKIAPVLFRRWSRNMAQLLPYVGDVKSPIGRIMKREGITHPFLKQILDIECFLLSGLKADATIAAEIAFMVGERRRPNAMEYPIGGASAIVDAFVDGIQRKGGKVRCKAHVERILVEGGRAIGVELRNGEKIYAEHVFSNASIWDTASLLPHDIAGKWKKEAMDTPVVESFMHVHIAIPNDGLEGIIGHHAVVIDSQKDVAEPGNTVMISIPTLWSPEIAPPGWHVVHAYTLQNYDGWVELRKNKTLYNAAKADAAAPLFQAIRHVIPDLDTRLEDEDAVVMIGSPATHARFNRRYKGTYGAAIDAGKAEFEWPGDIPVRNLKRCSDSTFPGIGVPSSAAAGLIAANELVSVAEHNQLIDRVFPLSY